MTDKFSITPNQIKALCALYKVVPMSSHKIHVPIDANLQIKYGLLFVDKDYNPVPVDNSTFEIAKSLYGIKGRSINSTFYDTFDSVTAKSRLELFIDQVIHYAGTYGREAAGLEPLTIVPMGEVNIPEIDTSKIKITVIRVINFSTIIDLVDRSFKTITRPTPSTVQYLEELIGFTAVEEKDVKSFELQVILHEHRNTVPADPKTLLRYLVYRFTKETTLVNNQNTVNCIKDAAEFSGTLAHDILYKADFIGLASIFLRYKNIFLAFKSHKGCAPIINKLRRMANTYHKPLSEDSVQNYLQIVLHGERQRARDIIKNADVFTLIKLANVIFTRVNMDENCTGVFNIRNGRSFCRQNAYTKPSVHELETLGEEGCYLLDKIAQEVRPNVSGKVFYIPEYIDYAAPTTEKQFIGNFPWGTVLHTRGKDSTENAHSVIGIQWTNNGDDRVDLDLHCFTADGQHFGWNSAFYGDHGKVIYSGDMTNAPLPDGAAEAFYLSYMDVPVIFTVNDFTGAPNDEFRFVVSAEDVDEDEDEVRNCVMDPNKLLFAPVPMQFHNSTSMTLGFFEDSDFYLYSGNLSEGAVPHKNFYQYTSGIINQQKHKLKLSVLLKLCGAIVVRSPEMKEQMEKHSGVNGDPVIDLSPENLTNTTLMEILGIN